jgi:hypothetical protein
MNEDIDVLLAERAIQRVLSTYARGVDRFDFEAVRTCYWPDGTDDHGSFVGGADDFIPFVETSLNRFERTNHFLGNILIYVDRFERRQGEWRMKDRVCAFDWRRTDRVDGAGGFADSYVRGIRSRDDIVYRILDGSRG